MRIKFWSLILWLKVGRTEFFSGWTVFKMIWSSFFMKCLSFACFWNVLCLCFVLNVWIFVFEMFWVLVLSEMFGFLHFEMFCLVFKMFLGLCFFMKCLIFGFLKCFVSLFCFKWLDFCVWNVLSPCIVWNVWIFAFWNVLSCVSEDFRLLKC